MERRSQPRYKTRIYGVFAKDIDLDETDVLMSNMSLGGAFLRTDNPAPPSTPVTLRFYLPECDAPISVSAEVVWARMPGVSDNPGMGVRFISASPDDLEKIKAYLASLVEEDLLGENGV